MRTALITAVYGGYDDLRPLPSSHGFDDAVVVTDDRELAVDGWRTVCVPSGLYPRLAAKLPKMQPWRFTDCESAVWLDASFSVRDHLFRQFADAHLDAADFVVWEHPDRANRDCLFDEALFCQDWPKYRDAPIREQVARYAAAGMPPNYGLWAAGAVGWRFTARSMEFGRRWHSEQHRGSIQDQISLPFLLWEDGHYPATWDADELRNAYIWHHGHRRTD